MQGRRMPASPSAQPRQRKGCTAQNVRGFPCFSTWHQSLAPASLMTAPPSSSRQASEVRLQRVSHIQDLQPLNYYSSPARCDDKGIAVQKFKKTRVTGSPRQDTQLFFTMIWGMCSGQGCSQSDGDVQPSSSYHRRECAALCSTQRKRRAREKQLPAISIFRIRLFQNHTAYSSFVFWQMN